MADRDENGRFLPGTVPNPKGRPKKGTALTDVLKERVDAQELANKLIDMAMDGDTVAMKYIYDRIDGKPIETKHISGEDGEPINIRTFSISLEDDGP
jgi:hypothetical protein